MISSINLSKPLLQVEALRTWFPILRGVFARAVGQIRAVDGVSLHINAGEALGLVGESGCGKSTLARTVVGLEHPTDGRIYFDGLDLLRASRQTMTRARCRLQMIFQDPYSSLNPRLTVMELVTEGLLAHGLIEPAARRDAAVAALREVGLDADALSRYPHEFSGGQRQRICIARAMALRPALVICDEPVSALDVSVRAQVLNLLNDLREQHGLAYLFISHDLAVVRHMADRVAVMYLGRIVEEGPAATVLDQPGHPYTRALVSATPVPYRPRQNRLVLPGDVPSASRPPPGCRFHPRCPFATLACAEIEPALERMATRISGHRVACLRRNELEPSPPL